MIGVLKGLNVLHLGNLVIGIYLGFGIYMSIGLKTSTMAITIKTMVSAPWDQ
jgi:hypothetical protein